MSGPISSVGLATFPAGTPSNNSTMSKRAEPLPRLMGKLFRGLLPHAERDEVVSNSAIEYCERRAHGAVAARVWLWSQLLGSVPALIRRGWFRGRTGFEPPASYLRPGGPMFESWIMDARYAARRLMSRPAFTLLTVLTLALGAGGTAAIFSVVRGLLLDPLPIAREEQIGMFWMNGSWDEAEILHPAPRVPGLLRGWRSSRRRNVGGPRPAAADGGRRHRDGGTFDVLGVRAMVGRTVAGHTCRARSARR